MLYNDLHIMFFLIDLLKKNDDLYIKYIFDVINFVKFKYSQCMIEYIKRYVLLDS